MQIRDLDLKECQFLFNGTTVGDALSFLQDNQLDYGLVQKDNGGVAGYVKNSILLELLSKDAMEPGSPIDNCCQMFASSYPVEASLLEIINVSQLPLLVYEKRARKYSVIDLEVIFNSILNLYRQKERLTREVDTILDFSFDEIYITDGNGVTLRVNKAFEENSGIPVEKVLGKNVRELEKEGIFKPSAARMVLEQGKQITTLQQYDNSDKRVLVTGSPVFNSDGSIFRVILNTRDTAKLNLLKSQLEETERLKERYSQELLEVNQFKMEKMVANSSSMTPIINTACKVAEVDTTVLLLGESGVGKTLLARYIHDNSPRKKHPFITISCGAIPENLLESELFGYEAGAFSGAHPKGKIGKIELANEGTLFLDEIGDLPLRLQVKILYVIQEGMLTRVGGHKEKKMDVRFITATNRNLPEMVKEGHFREDLYYRLNVVPLEIPPLRERLEDIEPLTQRFLQEYNKKCGNNKKISPEVLDYFKNYSWPGNVRELDNLIERLVIVVNGETIFPEHLPDYIKLESVSNSSQQEAVKAYSPLEKMKEDLEKKVLEKLYRQYENTYQVADILKINQSTVVRKLKKYKIT